MVSSIDEFGDLNGAAVAFIDAAVEQHNQGDQQGFEGDAFPPEQEIES